MLGGRPFPTSSNIILSYKTMLFVSLFYWQHNRSKNISKNQLFCKIPWEKGALFLIVSPRRSLWSGRGVFLISWYMPQWVQVFHNFILSFPLLYFCEIVFNFHNLKDTQTHGDKLKKISFSFFWFLFLFCFSFFDFVFWFLFTAWNRFQNTERKHNTTPHPKRATQNDERHHRTQPQTPPKEHPPNAPKLPHMIHTKNTQKYHNEQPQKHTQKNNNFLIIAPHTPKLINLYTLKKCLFNRLFLTSKKIIKKMLKKYCNYKMYRLYLNQVKCIAYT